MKRIDTTSAAVSATTRLTFAFAVAALGLPACASVDGLREGEPRGEASTEDASAMPDAAAPAPAPTTSPDLGPSCRGLDPTFERAASTESAFAFVPSRILVRPTGEVVVVGADPSEDTGAFLIAQFDASGRVDERFGERGLVRVPARGPTPRVDAALSPEGHVVIAGGVMELGGTWRNAALARITPNGTLDARFGANGIVVTDVGADDALAGVAIDQRGAIYAIGYSQSSATQSSIAFLRYTDTGGRVHEFSPRFKTIGAAWGQRVRLDREGRLVVVALTGDRKVELVARVSKDGVLDDTFGIRGQTWLEHVTEIANDGLVVLADGAVVTVGTTRVDGSADLTVTRLRPNGAIEPATCAGPCLVDLGGDDAASDALEGPDGTVYIVGRTQGTATQAFVARVLPSNRLDATFGTEGVFRFVFQDDAVAEGARSLARSEDHRLVLVGAQKRTVDAASSPVLARFCP